MSNCNCHHEIIRDGSGQLTRFLQALDPSYAPIDNRSINDLLVFIQKYAARIRFYDLPESKINDGIPPEKLSWESFFKKDIAVIVASVALTDTGSIKNKYDTLRASLEAAPSADKLAALLTICIQLASSMNEWYSLATQESPLFSNLNMSIHSVLAAQLQRIIAYEEGYKLIDPQNPFNLQYGALDNNPVWATDQPVIADATIYKGNTPEERIFNAALYADDIFNSFLQVIQEQVDQSDAYLQYALEEYPDHQPHIALFIAFLQLFQLAREQMNGITGRMLDYYYKDVLQLTSKGAVPDKVYVVFELAKNAAEYDLAKSTPLKAGKDSAGIEQIYVTQDDLVINQAKVKEIKTVFIEKQASTVNDVSVSVIKNIYANVVADSADGNGAPFPSNYKAWHTLGNGANTGPDFKGICAAIHNLAPAPITLNNARIGFAIASPQLVLGGGNRLIILTSKGISQLLSQFQNAETTNPLEIWVTSENGWLKINNFISPDIYKNLLADGHSFTVPPDISGPGYGFISSGNQHAGLFVFIPQSSDAIINFSPDIHQGYQYTTSNPVLQVTLNPPVNLAEDFYNQVTLDDLSVYVKVGSIRSKAGLPLPTDGLTSLILQNDVQSFEPGKPLDPFTKFPVTGKSFYIGSEEAFNKPLDQLAINIQNTDSSSSWNVSLFALNNKQWVAVSNGEDNVFSEENLSLGLINNNQEAFPDRLPLAYFTEWNQGVRKGFLRLDNQTTFTTGGELGTPLSPQESVARFEIKSISLSYSSSLTRLTPGIDQFFHVYPFGAMELPYRSIQNDRAKLGLAAASSFSPNQLVFPESHNKLFPQFTFTNPYDINHNSQELFLEKGQIAVRNPGLINVINRFAPGKNVFNQYSGNIQEEGILFIGLENAQPLQSVSMLFQFAEGSAQDEDDDPPAIHWSYLSNNQWIPLPGENLMNDDTDGFQTTGIIKISLPQDATHNNTIITSGLHWIRASVTENAGRIPMLINIVTQAVMAVFDDHDNSLQHYDQALAAGSIAKLKVPVSQVSKVSQPFASFDGKHGEIGKEFYTRVSERLRHKQRAITPWDYERLVLDRFSSVYKVKCITHTDPNCLCRKETNADGTVAECCGPQIAPGNVLLIPVANLQNRNGVNPLQPKTARRVLIEMVDYIKTLTSPFVKVYAKNPVYEQIIVFFRVQFIKGTDTGFYLKKLNDEIVEYLTPWAFHEDADLVFGQKVYASSIIHFIEKRSYVDFITDFEMGVCKQDCCPPAEINTAHNQPGDAETVIAQFKNCCDVEAFLTNNITNDGEIVAEPSTQRSILVSAPRHIIIPYVPPVILTPCEQKQLQQKQNINPLKESAGAITPVKPVISAIPATSVISATPVQPVKQPQRTGPSQAIKKTVTQKSTPIKKVPNRKAAPVKNKRSGQSG